MKAAIRRFVEHCDAQGLALDDRNFTLRYTSTIPRCVGLAGSSALITATLRGLMQFYGVDISKPLLATLPQLQISWRRLRSPRLAPPALWPSWGPRPGARS